MKQALARIPLSNEDFDYKEAARRLGLSVRTLAQLVKERKIKPLRPTIRSVRFNDAILDEFRASVKVSA